MNFYILSKLYFFNRIEVSERIDVKKTSASKECDICHYWLFLNFSFKFQPNVSNRFSAIKVLILAVLLA